MIEWGYDAGGCLVLERHEDLEKRRNLIKQIIQTCNSKSGCNTARCRCQKKDLKCILCRCKMYQNQGETDSSRELEAGTPNLQVNPAQIEDNTEHEDAGNEDVSSSDESATYKSDEEKD